jgi:hypothetical protein
VNTYGHVKNCYHIADRLFLVSCFVHSSTLKMETILHSETSTWLLPVSRASHPRRQLFRQAGYINSKHYFLWSDVQTWHCLAFSCNVIPVGPHIDRLCGLVVRVPGYRSRGRVQFPAIQDFPRSSWSGTGSTQPREYNWGVNGVICLGEK